MTLDQKYERLQGLLREMESVAVAFSAGVDSTLVLKVALDVLGAGNVVAVTGRSDSLAAAEAADALRIAELLGATHVILDTTEFDDPNYTSNPVNRCYFCKTTLYLQLGEFARARGLKCIVNGANVDDLGDHRPGMQAASEHSVCAPALEAGLTKADVRELSRRLGLPTFDKPASPCLSSRVPYGEPVTPEKLRMIEAGEEFLRSLGIRECRVRHHQGDCARIEVPLDDLPRLASADTAARIDAHFRTIGYKYVSVDLRGLRSGSLNEVIAFGKPQVEYTLGMQAIR